MKYVKLSRTKDSNVIYVDPHKVWQVHTNCFVMNEGSGTGVYIEGVALPLIVKDTVATVVSLLETNRTA